MKQEKKRAEPIKIPLDFKQTVLAALETRPERRKKTAKKSRRK
jgi:hypothetical protein